MMKMRRAIEGSSVRVPNARARRAKRGQKTESQNPKGFGSSGWTRTSNLRLTESCRSSILLILRACSSGAILLLPGVREQIGH
jgi:hypothetical protein